MSRVFICFHKKLQPTYSQEIIRGSNFKALPHVEVKMSIRYHLHLFAKYYTYKIFFFDIVKSD